MSLGTSVFHCDVVMRAIYQVATVENHYSKQIGAGCFAYWIINYFVSNSSMIKIQFERLRQSVKSITTSFIFQRRREAHNRTFKEKDSELRVLRPGFEPGSVTIEFRLFKRNFSHAIVLSRGHYAFPVFSKMNLE